MFVLRCCQQDGSRVPPTPSTPTSRLPGGVAREQVSEMNLGAESQVYRRVSVRRHHRYAHVVKDRRGPPRGQENQLYKQDRRQCSQWRARRGLFSGIGPAAVLAVPARLALAPLTVGVRSGGLFQCLSRSVWCSAADKNTKSTKTEAFRV